MINLHPAGIGRLCFERIDKRTVVSQAYSKSPLKILTPKNNGPSAWAYSSNFGGGFVGGDSIDIKVKVKAEAQAVLLSQASTKVYGSEKLSQLSITAEVEEGAILYSLPDPLVCFKQSQFFQKQFIQLKFNSSLLLLDTLHSGREYSGERWSFNSYRNLIEVWQEKKMIFFENLLLSSFIGDLVKRQGHFNALSLILMIGPAFKDEAQKVLDVLTHHPVLANNTIVMSASRIQENGIIIRLASVSTEILAIAIKELLSFVPQRLGDDPWARKW